MKRKKLDCQIYEVSKNKSNKCLLSLIKDFDVVVDCIFGSGLNRELRKIHKKIVEALNNSQKKLISVDIPSGIECDSGKILGDVVRADVTLCMGFLNRLTFYFQESNFVE